jgi:dienelactone hydrolase
MPMSSRTFAAVVLAFALAVVMPAAQQPAPGGAATQKAARAFPDASSHRAAFLKEIDRPRVPLAPALRSLPDDEGMAVQHVTIAVEAGERATALVVAPRVQGRRPAVVYLHGTGGSKERSLPRLKELAQRGFVAVGLDGRYHGERRGTGAEGDPYTDAIVAAFRTGQGHPFLYDSVWDVMRLFDYLEARDDVDPSRLGLTGFSKGGMETYLTAAVEPRVAAAVAKHGVQSFRWGLEHGAWDSRAWSLRTAVEGAAAEAGQQINPAFLRTLYDRIAPGLYGEFDGPAMVPLVAPRPFLIISGDSDPRTPQAGVRETARAAQAAYEAAKAADRFENRVLPDTGHEETPAGNAATVEWFVRWLKP